MNKKFMLVLAVVGFVAVSASPVLACPPGGEGHGCPFMALDHAKELGLSHKQKAQLEKMKKDFMNDMQTRGKKYGEDSKAVLTDAQKKQHDALQTSSGCDCHMKGKHHKKDAAGGQCSEKK